jgi:hypothetical protein
MAIPADIQAKFAAANQSSIPPGITPAYLAENRDKAPIAAIYFIFGLAVTLLLLRSFARIVLVKHFGLDDWLAVLTLVSIPATAPPPSDPSLRSLGEDWARRPCARGAQDL